MTFKFGDRFKLRRDVFDGLGVACRNPFNAPVQPLEREVSAQCLWFLLQGEYQSGINCVPADESKTVDIRLGNHPENGTSHKAQECEQNPKPRRHIFLKEAKKGERSV
jgi:hypothetical protein